MSDNHPAPKTIELWIRSFEPVTTGPTRERALDRLERLESTAAISSVEIDVWGKQIEETSKPRRIPQLRTIDDRLERFEQWADRTERSLSPFFRTRQVESTITDEHYEVRRLPTLALAEYVDGTLVHVAPCRDGDRTIDVFDRFDALEDETDASDDETNADGTRSNRQHQFVERPIGPN